MTRAWAVRSGLNPVHYVSRSSGISRTLVGLRRTADVNVLDAWDDLVDFAKPMSLGIGAAPVTGDVYGESEWRYVPRHASFRRRIPRLPAGVPGRDAQFDADIAAGNAATDVHGRLPFDIADVRYVFVPTDADIPRLVNFIESPALSRHAMPSRQLLLTRITSIETLLSDY